MERNRLQALLDRVHYTWVAIHPLPADKRHTSSCQKEKVKDREYLYDNVAVSAKSKTGFRSDDHWNPLFILHPRLKSGVGNVYKKPKLLEEKKEGA